MFTVIASAIVAIAKAFPAARAIFEQSVSLFYAYEAHEDQNQQTEIQEERDAIVAALKQPGMTDANRRVLRKRLIALSRL
jgi:hypothetical protein